MRINGIGHYDVYPKLNSVEELDTQQPVAEKQESNNEVSKRLVLEENASVELAAKLMSKPAFEPVGKNVDIQSLDAELGISDVQKDHVLEQYQYFVGDASMLENNEDGIVIQKSGF